MVQGKRTIPHARKGDHLEAVRSYRRSLPDGPHSDGLRRWEHLRGDRRRSTGNYLGERGSSRKARATTRYLRCRLWKHGRKGDSESLSLTQIALSPSVPDSRARQT